MPRAAPPPPADGAGVGTGPGSTNRKGSIAENHYPISFSPGPAERTSTIFPVEAPRDRRRSERDFPPPILFVPHLRIFRAEIDLLARKVSNQSCPYPVALLSPPPEEIVVEFL